MEVLSVYWQFASNSHFRKLVLRGCFSDHTLRTMYIIFVQQTSLKIPNIDKYT